MANEKNASKDTVRHIDTELMYEAVKAFETAYDEFHNCKDDITKIIDKVLDNWAGEGYEAFKKDYQTLTSQLKDLEDVLMDLREGIVTAEESYIEADAEVSKNIACGKTDTVSNKNSSGAGAW